MEQQKKIATGYVRVSTKDAEQLKSSENQQSYFDNFLKNHNDVEYYGSLYVDEGISGTKLKRKEFHRMLLDAGIDIEPHKKKSKDGQEKVVEYVYTISRRKPKFDIIYVKNTSRFSRTVSVNDIIEKLINKGVHIRFLDSGYSTEFKEQRDLINLMFTLDQRESRDKSIKVMFGKKESARKGRIFTNGKLYGYQYIQSENRLEIVEHEADIVREIFNLYISGYGCRRICKIINEKGYRRRDGGLFIPSDILNKIHNEKYSGRSNTMKYCSGTIFENKINWMKPQSKEDYKVEETDKIPAIIDMETWDRAQETLSQNQKYDNQKGKVTGRNLGRTKYASKLICTKCGMPYVRKRNSQGKFYLCCGTKHRDGKEACNAPNILIEDIEKQIEKYSGSYIYKYIKEHKEDMLLRILYLSNKLLDNIDKNEAKTVNEIEKQIENLTTKIENSYIVLFDNPNDNILQGLINKMKNELAELQVKKQNALHNNQNIYDDINRLIKEYKDAVERIPSFREYTIDEVIDMTDKFYITEGKIINFKLDCFKDLDDIYNKYFAENTRESYKFMNIQMAKSRVQDFLIDKKILNELI